ncbi:hypothetical protein KHA93_00775 [Bacillus sp. FJAT-49732]|uniref:Uncharacterized protein n=1 Tax=Lederbergia citrisecunda TaxID=2833583 RepID=A0A942TK91_9BACI|nr:hypothetical protein [Lederbergia citrisecunda]MBS4198192.1 hypothetical protein [Lederbergia citrisecunda]
MEKDRRQKSDDPKIAPGIDTEDSYGEDATQANIDKGDYTTVTRLVYDEYDPSEK